MFSLVSFQVSSKFWIKPLSGFRFNSTRLTCVQKMCPQEFCFENYDCVGFDLDHTLCRYKLRSLFGLIYKALASFLIENYDYPNSLADLSEADMSFAQKGIILDKRRGNFLKLDSQYRILKASHGTQLLSRESILNIYGENKIWEESRGIPHKLVERSALDEPFYVFKDYFVTAGAVICAKIVDILDQDSNIKSYSFWDQYLEGIYYMYERSNFKNNSGKFFPDLKNNPELYLQPCSDNLKRWLRNIHQHKVTFLLTSSNYDSADFIATYCLGEDWKSYFDIIVTFAKKPGFFWKSKPFCKVIQNTEVGVKPQEMKPNFIYSQGNYKELREVCSLLSKTQHPKTVYFGDSLIEDVYTASEVAGCDTVAIVEEMLAEGMENSADRHLEYKVLSSDFWGSFFCSDPCSDGTVNPSLWAHLLSQHSKLTIPDLESICKLDIQDKINCFGNDMTSSGYFPGVPKTLCSS